MILSGITDWFISDQLKHSESEYRTAKIVLYTKFVLLILALLLWFIAPLINDQLPFPVHLGIPTILLMIFTFRYIQNVAFAGNLLAAGLAMFLVPMTLYGGGLYSDNLLWLFIVPTTAFFLANIRSGVIWTIALLGFQFWLLRMEQSIDSSFLSYIKNISPEYYFFSYAFFFLFLSTIIIIFKRGQYKIVRTLNSQKAHLADQKQALTHKTKELELVQKNLEYSNRELEQFAYIVSHDLKAPLRNINSFSQLLERSLHKKGEMDSSTQEYLNFITGSVTNMNQLINDLLIYARAGNEVQAQEAVANMQDVKDMVSNNLNSMIVEYQAQIFWQNLPDTVATPKVKLVQLLQNLLSNAIKYRKESISPIIIVSCFSHKQHWEFSVKDNGVGIAKKDQKRVFDIFVKLQSAHYQTSSGIGLATCKKIIDQCGGNIWMTSAAGEGAIFHFTIPKSEEKGLKENIEPSLQKAG